MTMAKRSKYKLGQRWTFKGGIPAFEDTLVIGWVVEAHPEWGEKERTFDVYVRFSQSAKEHIPQDFDGIILRMTDAGLDRSVTKLVESGVELPWWWRYGRRFKREKDAPNTTGRLSCDSVGSILRAEYDRAVRRAEEIRDRAEALRKHEEKYGKLKKKPKPSKSVKESWKRIETWYAEHGPGRPSDLAKGATSASIKAFEKEIGATLPNDFKESVRIHDGSGWWVPPRHGELLSLELMLKQWRMYSEWKAKGDYAVEGGESWKPTDLKGPVKRVFWNQTRIHVSDNSGDHLTLDLDPPPKGKYGQVIHHSHEVGPTRVVAPSWTEFLSDLAVDLESGKFIYFEPTSEVDLLEYFIEER
jgi:cell wall assembly regulator SMI1